MSPAASALLRYLAGLGMGAAVSLAAWGLGWETFVTRASDATMLFAVPGAKLVGASLCMFFPGWRAFGAGLFSSIALGVLIFFGSCLYHFNG